MFLQCDSLSLLVSLLYLIPSSVMALSPPVYSRTIVGMSSVLLIKVKKEYRRVVNNMADKQLGRPQESVFMITRILCASTPVRAVTWTMMMTISPAATGDDTII